MLLLSSLELRSWGSSLLQHSVSIRHGSRAACLLGGAEPHTFVPNTIICFQHLRANPWESPSKPGLGTTLENAPRDFRSAQSRLWCRSVSPGELSPLGLQRVPVSPAQAMGPGAVGLPGPHCPAAASVPQKPRDLVSLGTRSGSRGVSSWSTAPPSSKELFSLKRCLDFSSSQSHFSTCVLTLFFRLLGREVGSKVTRIGRGAHFEKGCHIHSSLFPRWLGRFNL